MSRPDRVALWFHRVEGEIKRGEHPIGAGIVNLAAFAFVVGLLVMILRTR